MLVFRKILHTYEMDDPWLDFRPGLLPRWFSISNIECNINWRNQTQTSEMLNLICYFEDNNNFKKIQMILILLSGVTTGDVFSMTHWWPQ